MAIADLEKMLPQHLSDLRASGLSDAQIAACGFKSEPDPRKWKKWIKNKVGSDCPALCIPFFDANSNYTNYVRVKPDSPRIKDGKTIKYESPKGEPNRLYIPPPYTRTVLADASIPLMVTEGEKKAAKADQEKFACLGLVGVYGWQVKHTGDGPRLLIPDFTAVALAGRSIYIVYDSDLADNPHVLWAEYDLAQALTAAGAIVRVIRIPSPGPGVKAGLDDYLISHGAAGLQKLIDAAQPVTEPAVPRAGPSRGGVEVIVREDEHRVVEECIQALAGDDRLYQRSGNFVRVYEDYESKSLSIVNVDKHDLRRRVTAYASLFRIREIKEGLVKIPTNPPEWLAPQIASHPDKPGIRSMVGVSKVPIIRKDGSIQMEPGYDECSRMVYCPMGETFPPMPEQVNQAMAKAAAAELMDLIADFPIKTPAERSVFLSLTLSPMVRHLIDGQVPIHLFDSNSLGTGKGLIINCAGAIAIGSSVPIQTYTADQPEMRKIITSIVMSGKQMVHLDNLPSGGAIGNPVLDSLITSDVWGDRVLGGNQIIDKPSRTIWCASGNNISMKADASRRVIKARHETDESNPSGRQDFKHKDLLKYVQDNRPGLVIKALSIIAGYIQAGRPDMKLAMAGSFTGWTSIVRSAIVWAGQEDPWDTNELLREDNNDEAIELNALIEAWEEIAGESEITVAAAKKKYTDTVNEYGRMIERAEDKYPAVSELLVACRLRGFDAIKLQYMLRKHRGKISYNGKSINGFKDGHTKAMKWRVIKRSSAVQTRHHPQHPPQEITLENKPENQNADDADDTLPSLYVREQANEHAHTHTRPAVGSSASSASSASLGDKYGDE